MQCGEPLNNAVKTSVALEALPVTDNLGKRPASSCACLYVTAAAATLNGLNNVTTTYFPSSLSSSSFLQ